MKVKFFIVKGNLPQNCAEEMQEKINGFILADEFKNNLLLDIKFDIIAQGSDFVCTAILLYSEHEVKESKKGLLEGDLEALSWFEQKAQNKADSIRTKPHSGKAQ